MVIVTDGESNVNPFDTLPEANRIKRSGTSIITVAVGLSSNTELVGLTSPPISDNLIHVDDFEALHHLSDQIVAPLCSGKDSHQTCLGRSYIRAEHKLHSISKLFISQVMIPQVMGLLFFFSLFIFCVHSTWEPASSRVTYFILQAYTGTKKIGRGLEKMQVNGLEG